jgi:hypothetical protein
MNDILVVVCVLGGGAGFGLVLIAALWFFWGRGGEVDDADEDVADCSAGCRAFGGWDFVADDWNDGSDCD